MSSICASIVAEPPDHVLSDVPAPRRSNRITRPTVDKAWRKDTKGGKSHDASMFE
jgi:hypothetical protein